MPKIPTPLSDREISSAKFKDKAYTISDGGGLQLLVKANGAKVWEFYYQSPTLYKRRKTSFGSYPKVKLAEARGKRDKYNAMIFKGIDPIDFYKKQKDEAKKNKKGLFEKVVNEWMEKQKDRLTDTTYKKKLNLFVKFVNPYFEDRAIATIKHPEIVKVLEDKAITAPETSTRLFNYLDNLWRYATMKGYCDFNIITNIHRQSIIRRVPRKSYAKITDLDILKELINSIYTFEGHNSTKNALKFVLHIPLRAKNLINLTWNNIDFDKKLLTIPREQMKNKNINLPDFIMPLSNEVINILQEQYQFTSDRSFIFMGDKGSHIHPETPNRALQRLDFNNEIKGRKQRLHSFRGTFRSICETYEPEHHIREKIQEIALDHYDKSSVVMAYKNKANYQEQLKLLMDWWSGFIAEMID